MHGRMNLLGSTVDHFSEEGQTPRDGAALYRRAGPYSDGRATNHLDLDIIEWLESI